MQHPGTPDPPFPKTRPRAITHSPGGLIQTQEPYIFSLNAIPGLQNPIFCTNLCVRNLSMKKYLPCFLVASLFFFPGCKKAIEKIKQDAVVQAMTDGQWKITSFTRDGVDITTDFSTYKFKYYSNKTVDAINNGAVEKTGTWDGDASTMTTSANFTNATEPLSLINGNWHIDDNSWTFVVASQVTGTGTKTMRLVKI